METLPHMSTGMALSILFLGVFHTLIHSVADFPACTLRFAFIKTAKCIYSPHSILCVILQNWQTLQLNAALLLDNGKLWGVPLLLNNVIQPNLHHTLSPHANM